jgi:hypothetical protein
MSITDDRARRVFALEVAGLPVRYVSGSFNASSSNLASEIVSGISYEDVEGIYSVGAYAANLDPSGGVASYSPISITLYSDRVRGGANDPSVIFGRCGARASAPFRAQITSELEYVTDSGTLDIDTTVSGVTYPALFHIGAETLKVTGVTAIAGGDRLTVSDRAVGGSQRQTHLITQGGTNVPEVSTAITTFRGRRASLWVAQELPGGTLTDFTQIVNGFLDSSPIVEEGGTVSLSLTPIIALLDGEVTERGRNSTKLLQDFHYYTGREGSYLEWATYLKDGGSDYYIERASITSSLFEMSYYQPDELTHFWFQGPNGVEPIAERNHPRYPRLEGRYENSTEQVFYPVSSSGVFVNYDSTISSYNTSGTSEYIHVRTNSQAEVKQVELGSGEVKQWPEVVVEELNNQSPYITGYDGSWVRWQIGDNNTIIITSNGDPGGVRPRVLLTQGSYSGLTWDDGAAFGALHWTSDGPRNPLWLRYRLWYPIDIRPVDSEALFPEDPRTGQRRASFQRIFSCPDNQSQRPIGYNFRGIARSYYQWRELVMLVEDSLGLPATATAGESYDIQIKYVDRRDEETKFQWIKATHQTSATYDGSTVGYVIHLDPAQDWDLVSSFGDWPDLDRAEIYGGAIFDRERPGEIMLKLLQSGGGDAKLGTYDVYSIGLAIPSTEIDEASFLTYDAASAFTFSGAISGDGVKVRDVIDSMLKAMSCALIMKRDMNGRSLITLQPLGAERSADVTATINEGDWLADQPPTWSIYEDVVTQTVVRFNWDTEEATFNSEATFNNQEAINRYGGERSKTTLDLYGLTTRDLGDSVGDTLGYFLPVVARQWNLLSNPLRLWRGSIGTGQSLLLDVGAYVQVSSPLLKGYGDEWGVTGEVGMIQAMTQELMGEGAQLEIISTGTRPVAWNASADVTAITSTTELEVAASSYSDSSADDVSFFEAGDVVDYLPRGDEDNAITGLTIDSIAGNIITFTGAHGVTVTGGTLEPTIYTSASAHHKADAYLASNTSPPVLGSSTEAQRYS